MLFIKQSDTLFAANPSLSRLNSVSLDFRCRNNNSKELHIWVLYLQVPFLLQTVLVGADSVVATVFALHFFCPYQTMRLLSIEKTGTTPAPQRHAEGRRCMCPNTKSHAIVSTRRLVPVCSCRVTTVAVYANRGIIRR